MNVLCSLTKNMLMWYHSEYFVVCGPEAVAVDGTVRPYP
jgi:hypothetical protein